ncbi:hypothetical protein BBBOND_0204490 [Babesia bigemina]|uniref:BRCT domain-containing protein n=1 Tax=Babesia bigemina TaxID=5866 RepID=A0A061D3L6_BABBI|nr:hypothetical protein BBBOND_0204490 [Babesia bigemina]CDR95291.1 hypothetical protein BBBOND_0204490 [Babesia bigemina]|eukprot:XP_012767477.1 hypothetical protein BBBOND_0204490 [Babesia bigemina]
MRPGDSNRNSSLGTGSWRGSYNTPSQSTDNTVGDLGVSGTDQLLLSATFSNVPSMSESLAMSDGVASSQQDVTVSRIPQVASRLVHMRSNGNMLGFRHGLLSASCSQNNVSEQGSTTQETYCAALTLGDLDTDTSIPDICVDHVEDMALRNEAADVEAGSDAAKYETLTSRTLRALKSMKRKRSLYSASAISDNVQPGKMTGSKTKGAVNQDDAGSEGETNSQQGSQLDLHSFADSGGNADIITTSVADGNAIASLPARDMVQQGKSATAVLRKYKPNEDVDMMETGSTADNEVVDTGKVSQETRSSSINGHSARSLPFDETSTYVTQTTTGITPSQSQCTPMFDESTQEPVAEMLMPKITETWALQTPAVTKHDDIPDSAPISNAGRHTGQHNNAVVPGYLKMENNMDADSARNEIVFRFRETVAVDRNSPIHQTVHSTAASVTPVSDVGNDEIIDAAFTTNIRSSTTEGDEGFHNTADLSVTEETNSMNPNSRTDKSPTKTTATLISRDEDKGSGSPRQNSPATSDIVDARTSPQSKRAKTGKENANSPEKGPRATKKPAKPKKAKRPLLISYTGKRQGDIEQRLRKAVIYYEKGQLFFDYLDNPQEERLTHLIAPLEIQRPTLKVLYAICHGAFILTPNYLEEAEKNEKWPSEVGFEHPRWPLRASRMRPLDLMRTIRAFAPQNGNKLSLEDITSLITLCGGKMVNSAAAATHCIIPEGTEPSQIIDGELPEDTTVVTENWVVNVIERLTLLPSDLRSTQ